MITIQNNTEDVVVVSNCHFTIDIPIGETVEVDEKDLQGDSFLYFRYFSAYNEEVMVDFGIKRGGIRRRLYAYFEYESTFPLVTGFSIADEMNLVLKDEYTNLRKILIFKTVRLRRITETSCGNHLTYLFPTQYSKKRFLKRMRISLLYLPVALILLLCCVLCLFCDYNWMDKAILLLLFGGIILLMAEDVQYYLLGRRCKVYDEVVE